MDNRLSQLPSLFLALRLFADPLRNRQCSPLNTLAGSDARHTSAATARVDAAMPNCSAIFCCPTTGWCEVDFVFAQLVERNVLSLETLMSATNKQSRSSSAIRMMERPALLPRSHLLKGRRVFSCYQRSTGATPKRASKSPRRSAIDVHALSSSRWRRSGSGWRKRTRSDPKALWRRPTRRCSPPVRRVSSRRQPFPSIWHGGAHSALLLRVVRILPRTCRTELL